MALYNSYEPNGKQQGSFLPRGDKNSNRCRLKGCSSQFLSPLLRNPFLTVGLCHLACFLVVFQDLKTAVSSCLPAATSGLIY